VTTRRRRRSLLEDDELVEIAERPAASSGDLCERCACARTKHEHGNGPCSCGKCEEFLGFDST
jgi:hypothetical protein